MARRRGAGWDHAVLILDEGRSSSGRPRPRRTGCGVCPRRRGAAASLPPVVGRGRHPRLRLPVRRWLVRRLPDPRRSGARRRHVRPALRRQRRGRIADQLAASTRHHHRPPDVLHAPLNRALPAVAGPVGRARRGGGGELFEFALPRGEPRGHQRPARRAGARRRGEAGGTPAHSCFNRCAGSHAGVPSSYWLSVSGLWLEPSAFMMNSSAYGCGWLRTSGDSSL